MFEETPPTMQSAAPQGVGREPWLRNRNGTSIQPVTMRCAKSPSMAGWKRWNGRPAGWKGE